jgi:recombination DNA repair RAD52 pathway protein
MNSTPATSNARLRETVDSRCVLARENRGSFLAVYTARVRISVHAGGATIIREGHGSGEGRSASPGEVHDTALKAAETDATKRALATFGKPFGLALYGSAKTPSTQQGTMLQSDPAKSEQRFGFHPDDTDSKAIALLWPSAICSIDRSTSKQSSRRRTECIIKSAPCSG